MATSNWYTGKMVGSATDTICAVASGQGPAGIAVVRISGSQAFDICDRVLRHSRICKSYKGFSLHRAELTEGGEVVDDVLVSVFHAPRSFTGEDTVEISCHGGYIPAAKTISALLSAGCRTAEPGEFSRRAFFNGKLDLSEAEGISDLINARTDKAYRSARGQSSGHLSRHIRGLRDRLLSVLARIEATIDFPEDVGEIDISACFTELSEVQVELDKLHRSSDRGILLRQGAQVVLVGKPNVGKSSLMNALLHNDRAIVSDIPGTTRDTIEEMIDIGGVAVRLWDTAGLRSTADPVEAIGVERSRLAIESADLVLFVRDASALPIDEDYELNDLVSQDRILEVWNKCDLGEYGKLRVSAANGTGIAELEHAIKVRLLGTESYQSEQSVYLAHVYQKTAVRSAITALKNAKETLNLNLPIDLVSVDLQLGLTALGEITGQTTPEDVISEIFSKFCIGK